jgi:CyaY protein
MPDQQAYLHAVDRLLEHLVARFDDFDPDEVEAEPSEGVLRLTFADGSRCVLNRQSAAQQVWLAEGSSAWHFEYSAADRKWLDTKGRGELLTILAGVLKRRLGRRVDLSGPT